MAESKIKQLVENAAFLTQDQKAKMLRLTAKMTPEKLTQIEQFFENTQRDIADMIRVQNAKRQKITSKNG
ncbi:hypothetical protein COW94_00360 [Candidatus Peregrinibacteria bacterium CG22_combo_CG10-13_8_21_14_all_44_10]|nr:MAG: hypothetical protein AUK45_02515 [Candidatus Peregrinibacteria bacterium CG2_30_44_17]PIP66703.1 MAG: hypothetical protein COW94_00360 [Candidatus Peregrinibacteria bacterium CG22_combo_CG10-13_8_21_14_all_44_10]PIS03835.1 MAG: hypothetical protein COT83_03940 [Candidatus Peregrinibacteria bacterium CG10_big_fil_rev_8_21_14_0_10_44_7]PIX80652.1 MAG: hypothetical protein COZ35_00170 [Candidatus Peregrinibacteria bacterium CG_4_10_14_3_um_filter_44_21]PJB89680.1 MAG: hypothetical protein 